jgi:rfaE bifunctional protein kinase chain/domain
MEPINLHNINKFFDLATMDLSSYKVLVVGDLMLDRYWKGEVTRISPEAPVPVVRITNQTDKLGGAANVALNLSFLNITPILIGVVGPDEAGEILRKLIAQEKIKDCVIEDKNAVTTIKLRVVNKQQQLIRLDIEDYVFCDAVTDKFKEVLPDVDLVIISDYAKGCVSNVKELIHLARKKKIPILVDPKGNDYIRYSGATMITPNKTEFTQIVGETKSEEEFYKAAHNLREKLNIDYLLVTRSEEGMTLFSKNNSVLHIEAKTKEVFDVSGAGDTVISTIAATMASGMSVEKAVKLSNKAAGIVVGKYGTAAVRYDELFL